MSDEVEAFFRDCQGETSGVESAVRSFMNKLVDISGAHYLGTLFTAYENLCVPFRSVFIY